MASMVVRVLGASVVGSAAFGAAATQADEGFRRSVAFWSVALPTYVHYRAVELAVQGRSDDERQAAYARLHRRYAPVMEKLVYDLRGFYLKLVQVGSTRDEFLPEEYMRWAKKTQDSVPTELDGDEVRDVVERSLGVPVDEVFQDFSPEPIGAASIGQVHRATLLDGRDVVVKVQYPRIEERFRSDVQTSMRFARLFQPHQVPFMEEVERQFRTEFDYHEEAQNLRTVRDKVMPTYGDRVVIPEPIEPLCTRNVLVMEYLPGTRLIDGIREQYGRLAARLGQSIEELEAEQRERVLASNGGMSMGAARRSTWLLNAYFAVVDGLRNFGRWLLNNTAGWFGPRWPYEKPLRLLVLADVLQLVIEVHGFEVLECGSFNADPHPGNILLCPDGRLGLIDYGQVKHLDRESRLAYARLMDALHRDDHKRIVEVYTGDMQFASARGDPRCTYRRACFFHDRDTDDVTEGLDIQAFMEHTQKVDPVVHIGEEFILAGRLSFLLRGIGNAFNIQVRISDYWYPFAQRLLHAEGEL